MVVLTGKAKGHTKRDGRLTLVEFVRLDNGDVWSRVKGGMWTFEANVPVDQVAFKGNTWCTHPTVLAFYSKLRLPAVK